MVAVAHPLQTICIASHCGTTFFFFTPSFFLQPPPFFFFTWLRDEDVAGNMVRCAQMAGEIEAAGLAEHKAKERANMLLNERIMAEKRAEREKAKEEDKVSG